MLEPVFDAIALFFQSTWGMIAFIAVAFIIVFAFSKHRKVFIATLLIAGLLGVGLKAFLNQDRPCVDLTSRVACPKSEGFPSDHMVIATALALGVLGTIFFWPFALIAAIIGLSRIWLGVHTFDQVAGGAALSVMVFLAVFYVHQRLYGIESSKYDLDSLLDDSLLTKKVD